MQHIHDPQEMQRWALQQRQQGKRIALTPTMGYFHQGHLSLMRLAAKHADLVVVSLFVNPTQFGPNEDLDRYPRNLERDLALAEREGVSVIFTPTAALMYPPGFETEVRIPKLASHLCGRSRPGHFAGVATVVSKLFQLVQPHAAVFGQKDFQQLAIIRRLVSDLHFPISILAHPIVREADGLAMSSRNANLDPANRAAALSLYEGVNLARGLYASGERSVARLRQAVEAHIQSFQGAEIDYVSFVDAASLEAVESADQHTVLALAVYVAGLNGQVRLIDNALLSELC